MSFKWLEQNKTWAHFMVLVLSLLPLLSSRMSKFVGTKGKRWLSIWLYCVLCAYRIKIHIRWKKPTWAARAKQMKRMPLTKEHWVFRDGSWNMPDLRMEASEHQSFPLGWQALAKEQKMFSSRYFECQWKKKPSWINVDFEENDIA